MTLPGLEYNNFELGREYLITVHNRTAIDPVDVISKRMTSGVIGMLQSKSLIEENPAVVKNSDGRLKLYKMVVFKIKFHKDCTITLSEFMDIENRLDTRICFRRVL